MIHRNPRWLVDVSTACGMPRRRAVTAAIVRGAQVRAAFDHLARDLDVRRVVARGLGPTARVLRDAAGFGCVGLVLWRIPVGRPLPHVADHVVDAVAVRWERRHRRGSFVAVERKILVRKTALPGVGHVLAAGRELVTPRKLGAVKTATRGELPFRFRRQLLSDPPGIGFGIAVRDVNHGVIIESADRGTRPIGPAPVRAELECPPLGPVAQIDRMLGRREDERAGLDHVRQCGRIVSWVGLNLGERDVTGGVDELAKVTVGDWRTIDPEASNRDMMDRRLLRVVLVRSHAERRAGDPDHARVGLMHVQQVVRSHRGRNVRLAHYRLAGRFWSHELSSST